MSMPSGRTCSNVNESRELLSWNEFDAAMYSSLRILLDRRFDSFLLRVLDASKEKNGRVASAWKMFAFRDNRIVRPVQLRRFPRKLPRVTTRGKGLPGL